MKTLEPQRHSMGKLGPIRRKAVSVSQEGLIRTECLWPEKTLPLMVQPVVDGIDLISWATNNLALIQTYLFKHGAILFRNFPISKVAEFEQFITVISGELLKYTYRSTPRSHVSGNIYTSTEYPADQYIPLHNEMAYSSSWPMKIWFYCVKSADHGGETPIADSRKVFERINPKIREQFMQKRVMYVRNYGDGLDLHWQNVFQTADKLEVENYCRSNGIEYEWKDRDRLRTRQLCQAVAKHPRTGEMVWFNQAHLFHISSLKSEVSKSLLSAFKEEDLPRNTYYGDGSPIEDSALNEIREIYRQEAVSFPWREGDILMLDNMLAAHGRTPYEGPRQIVVGMAEPFSSKDI